MRKKSQQGLDRGSRLLPYLGVAPESGLSRMASPVLDGRNLRAMVAHCVNLGELINFFETSNFPSGTWGDVLRLSPEIAAACLLEEDLLQEKTFGTDRPMRIAATVDDNLSSVDTEQKNTADTLIREELDWQNTWSDRLGKAGVSISLPPFPQWPGELSGELADKLPKEFSEELAMGVADWPDTMESRKAYCLDAALRIKLRRSILLDKATALWDKAVSCPGGNLAPHVGMLLAFLQRYSHLQQGYNSLVPLYVSHFYEQIMRFSPRPAVPDRVLACFSVEPDTPWSTVPAGSLLTVPGQPVSFITESHTPFSQIKLGGLRAISPMTLPGPFMRSSVPEKGEENSNWMPFGDSDTSSLGVGSTLIMLPGMELAGGKRTLKFELKLQSELGFSNFFSENKEPLLNELKDNPFTVDISGDGGWITPQSLANVKLEKPGSDSSLLFNFDLILAVNQPAIISPQEDSHGLTANHPVLRLVPRVAENNLWKLFHLCCVAKIKVTVSVSDFWACELIVDGNAIPSPVEGSIPIFGATPLSASFFVLTVPELEGKYVKSVKLHWDWEAPAKFEDYFKGYPFEQITLSSEVRNGEGALPKKVAAVTIVGKETNFLDCPLPDTHKATSWRFTLSSEGSLFGQAEYPRILTQAVLNESSIIADPKLETDDLLRLKDINPPFIPKWKDIKVDYTASFQWTENLSEMVSHEHPWSAIPPRHPEHLHLFPYYDSYSLSLEFASEVKRDKEIPLSLYFRLQNMGKHDEGSIMSIQGADIWKDETNGLTQSGIMGLTPHTVCPDGNSPVDDSGPESFRIHFNWTKNPNIILQGIHEHAVWAIYAPKDENASNARSFPLPPGSLAEVTAPELDTENVSLDFSSLKVTQPYPSTGGRSGGGPSTASYRQDCAEELSHRGQAILPRDFERLILREFPDVLVALCVPHSLDDLAGNSPGSVAVVIFSPQEDEKMYGKEKYGDDTFTLDPYIPAYTDDELIHQIAEYVDSRSSPYAAITIANPVYRKVDGTIEVRPDKMKNTKEAKDEIRRFLAENIAPWAFAPLVAAFGQTLDMTYLYKKLQSFPWVLGVDCFKLTIESKASPIEVGSETLVAETGVLFYLGQLDFKFNETEQENHD